MIFLEDDWDLYCWIQIERREVRRGRATAGGADPQRRPPVRGATAVVRVAATPPRRPTAAGRRRFRRADRRAEAHRGPHLLQRRHGTLEGSRPRPGFRLAQDLPSFGRPRRAEPADPAGRLSLSPGRGQQSRSYRWPFAARWSVGSRRSSATPGSWANSSSTLKHRFLIGLIKHRLVWRYCAMKTVKKTHKITTKNMVSDWLWVGRKPIRAWPVKNTTTATSLDPR